MFARPIGRRHTAPRPIPAQGGDDLHLEWIPMSATTERPSAAAPAAIIPAAPSRPTSPRESQATGEVQLHQAIPVLVADLVDGLRQVGGGVERENARRAVRRHRGQPAPTLQKVRFQDLSPWATLPNEVIQRGGRKEGRGKAIGERPEERFSCEMLRLLRCQDIAVSGSGAVARQRLPHRRASGGKINGCCPYRQMRRSLSPQNVTRSMAYLCLIQVENWGRGCPTAFFGRAADPGHFVRNRSPTGPVAAACPAAYTSNHTDQVTADPGLRNAQELQLHPKRKGE